MLLRSFKFFVATLIAMLLCVACGGESAPAPTGLVVVPGESSATLSWDSTEGVEYWVFYAPTASAPSTTTSMSGWIGLYGGGTLLKVTSPYVVAGLTNGISYSFSVNARTNGGPGGPGATPVTATPVIAGSNWSAGTPISTNDFLAVTYGAVTTTTVTNSITTTTTTKSTYVAAGSAGAMYSSPDGITWSAINYATTSDLNGAAFFGSYKLVGNGGVVLTSADAITWIPQSSRTTKDLYAIASNNLNLNVAVGAAGTIITSPDGVVWTAATNSATTEDLYAVSYNSYGSGTWVAVGAGGTLIESADGLTWHSVASGTTADLHGLAATTTVSTAGVITSTFVAAGAAGTVLSRVDGGNWTPQVLPGASNVQLHAVTYGTQFVAVGEGGKIFFSTNGSNWTAATSNNGKALYAVVHGLYSYSAVGAAGTNLLSK